MPSGVLGTTHNNRMWLNGIDTQLPSIQQPVTHPLVVI